MKIHVTDTEARLLRDLFRKARTTPLDQYSFALIEKLMPRIDEHLARVRWYNEVCAREKCSLDSPLLSDEAWRRYRASNPEVTVDA